ncbi:MAG: hypothetical protein FJ209_09175 [Betaproteobacteria bacterium]|nr:hypothetical protein [Betaproteobacteria bacterium]
MPRIISVPAPACKSDPRSVCPPWITARADLLEAVSTFATRAAVKLRHEGQAAGGTQVFLSTNPFIPGETQYQPAVLVSFSSPTHDTARLIQAARSGLNRIFRTGFRYKKAASCWGAGAGDGALGSVVRAGG